VSKNLPILRRVTTHLKECQDVTSGGGTVVEHSPHHSKVEVSSLAIAAGTGWGKIIQMQI